MTDLLEPTAVAAPAVPRGSRTHRPLAIGAVRLSEDSVLGAWQRRNAQATIPHCIEQLEASGVLDNLRRVVGESGAAYRGFVFADSDLYKTIEAVAWEIARSRTREFDGWLDDVIGLVARVQEPSGYVHSWIQGVHPEKKFAELDWTHEMYVLGHLVQAAVALDRAAGRRDLLDVALRFTELLDRRFGPGREEGICGHPEIETALVELFRHTGQARWLELAAHFIDLRGRGLLKVGSLGAQYFQDHAPVREARTAVGHAVRQLYLDAGVADVHLETGEPALLESTLTRWRNAHERKMYLTGAFGSRHRDEAFGDDFELPSDRAYAETCATIADLHWTWRLHLTGPRGEYADVVEREMHNALAASVDATATRFFYSNPLQLRPDRSSEENAPRERTAWYACACCPPNIARTVAQLSAYVASVSSEEFFVHQFTAGEIDLPAELGGATLHVRTQYPAEGSVEFTVAGDVTPGRSLAVRVPQWSRGSSLVSGESAAAADGDGYARLPLVAGATYRLDLDVRPRWTAADPRLDAVRGCLALERGPLVYCVESTDVPAGVDLGSLVVDPAVEPVAAAGNGVEVQVRVQEPAAGLYAPRTEPSTAQPLTVTAVPFGSWGNRGARAMRVWLPTTH